MEKNIQRYWKKNRTVLGQVRNHLKTMHSPNDRGHFRRIIKISNNLKGSFAQD
jgi:hypothetical protein